jgi:hypothetical protein
METYSVIVSIIGTVYTTDDHNDALNEYYECTYMSKFSHGRISGESVAIVADGDTILEYKGTKYK